MTETLDGDVITDEMRSRAKMMEGTNGGVEFRVKDSYYIADWLCDKGYIDQSQIWDCQTFMDLRAAYQAFFGVKWGALRYTAEPSSMSGGDALRLHDAIRREIGLPRADSIIPVVIHAMTELSTREANYSSAVSNAYREAIEALANACFAIMKKKSEILQENICHSEPA